MNPFCFDCKKCKTSLGRLQNILLTFTKSYPIKLSVGQGTGLLKKAVNPGRRFFKPPAPFPLGLCHLCAPKQTKLPATQANFFGTYLRYSKIRTPWNIKHVCLQNYQIGSNPVTVAISMFFITGQQVQPDRLSKSIPSSEYSEYVQKRGPFVSQTELILTVKTSEYHSPVPDRDRIEMSNINNALFNIVHWWLLNRNDNFFSCL